MAIYVYNETSYPFNLEDMDKERHAKRISTTRPSTNKKTKLINSKIISINVIADDTFKIDNIHSLIGMREVQKVNDGIINTLFRTKDNRPVLTTKHKYSKNVFFIALKLKGGIVSAINSETIYVLNYMILNNELILIAATNNDKDNVELTISNNVANTSRQYKFYNSNGEYNVAIEESTLQGDASPCKLVKFRPARPTHLIFTHKNDLAALKALDSITPSAYEIAVISSREELLQSIDKYKADGYSAATLFINSENMYSDDYKIYRNNDFVLNESFRIYNVLLKNGKIVKK